MEEIRFSQFVLELKLECCTWSNTILDGVHVFFFNVKLLMANDRRKGWQEAAQMEKGVMKLYDVRNLEKDSDIFHLAIFHQINEHFYGHKSS